MAILELPKDALLELTDAQLEQLIGRLAKQRPFLVEPRSGMSGFLVPSQRPMAASMSGSM
jgi:hypothetical protein